MFYHKLLQKNRSSSDNEQRRRAISMNDSPSLRLFGCSLCIVFSGIVLVSTAGKDAKILGDELLFRTAYIKNV
jgi:hypothetical protein